MYGFGIPGQGFYAFNFPEANVKVAETTALILVLSGEASEEKLDKELKHLVSESCDFRVRKMDSQEYMAIFADKFSPDSQVWSCPYMVSMSKLENLPPVLKHL